MTKVKICGITNYEDARCCVDAGADFLGFIFYKKSERWVSPVRAKKIIEKLGAPVFKVGVFVNEDPEVVRRIARQCSLDFLQFHGEESPAYVKSFKDHQLIKALRIKDRLPPDRFKLFENALLLFDTFSKDVYGGTGRAFDWGCLKKVKRPFFISGGLTPGNVREVLKVLEPFAVDASSGVEKRPGKKDHQLVRKFIHIAKH
jgi:phosphoribosylanthranilate isomerase